MDELGADDGSIPFVHALVCGGGACGDPLATDRRRTAHRRRGGGGGILSQRVAHSLVTGSHLLVIWHLLASGRTIIAAFCTALARDVAFLTIDLQYRGRLDLSG